MKKTNINNGKKTAERKVAIVLANYWKRCYEDMPDLIQGLILISAESSRKPKIIYNFQGDSMYMEHALVYCQTHEQAAGLFEYERHGRSYDIRFCPDQVLEFAVNSAR